MTQPALSPTDLVNFLTNSFTDLVVHKHWGETSLFYNPHHILKRGIYFVTIKEQDGKHDQASKLNRPDIYRLSLGISKETFKSMFGNIPPRPPAGQIVNMDYDFTQLDQITPHPIYSWMAWICVLSPTHPTLKPLAPLLFESYSLAQAKFRQKNTLT